MQLILFLGEARFTGLTCDLVKALASSGNDLFTLREGRAGFCSWTSLEAASGIRCGDRVVFRKGALCDVAF